MDKSEAHFFKLEKMLDKEQEYLLNVQREHHLSWDNHILTLSVAAVGFVFSLLPLHGSELLWLAIIGVIAFALSIVCTLFNYIVADKGMRIASESNMARRIMHDKLFHRVNKLKRDIDKIESEDKGAIQRARDLCWKDVDALYGERDTEKDIVQLECNNCVVRVLNHAKTYTFLTGVVAITIFALLNLSKL